MIDKTLIEELKTSIEEIFSRHNMTIHFNVLDVEVDQGTYTAYFPRYITSGIYPVLGSGTEKQKVTVCFDCYKTY